MPGVFLKKSPAIVFYIRFYQLWICFGLSLGFFGKSLTWWVLGRAVEALIF